MIIDATFWVAVSFLIFVFLLIYFKIPFKIKNMLDENILQIKKQIEESEKLKEEAKNKLADHEKRIVGSKSEVQKMLRDANDIAEKAIIKSNEIFHNQMEIKKKNTEEKIKQLKSQAVKDIKNASINIAF